MDPLTPGRQVGKYEVVRRLAFGGMAEIYLARVRGIEGFEKYVVLKRILPQYAENEGFVRMFLNEARLAATLDHPNIASVYDIDQRDGVYFFTMEYLHGEDVGYLLHELRQRNLGLPLEHAMTIGAGVAAGLHHAHEKRGPDGKPLGIVHRDISPSNVVVTFGGGVKLVDFGIAKVTSAAELTGSGALKGKLAYMAPEQVLNQPVDRRTDVFSLGIMLYELTTQTRLFKGETEVDTIQLVMKAQVPPPSERVPNYPPELEAIVCKALARIPDDRWSTARELQLALESFAGGRGFVISTAILGEWMERTFGPKIEPWRAKFEADKQKELAPDSVPTRVVSEESAARNVAPMVPPRRRRQAPRGWLVAAGLATMAGGGAAFLMSKRPEPPSAAATPIYVVPEKGQVALEPVHAAPATAAAPGTKPAAPMPVTAVPPPAARRPRTGRPDPAARAQADTLAYSAAFQRRERDLTRCFAEFPSESAAAGQLFVRFEASADGRVTAAEVLPADVAHTPLGSCIAKVAMATQFGPLPKAIAFRIPVHVRRLDGTGKP